MVPLEQNRILQNSLAQALLHFSSPEGNLVPCSMCLMASLSMTTLTDVLGNWKVVPVLPGTRLGPKYA